MSLEWGWLRKASRVDLDNQGIFLQGDGGCTVLLLHGLTGAPLELGYLAYHLRHRGGHSVHVPRLVNHGQPLGVLARTTWRQLYASAQEAFIEARAAARAQRTPLVVGGLSLGAVMSLMLAAEHPGDVAGVAGLSPTLFYDGWNVPWYHRLIPVAAYTPLKYFSFFREGEPFGLRDEALRRTVAEQYSKMALDDCADAKNLGYAHFPVRLFCEMQPLISRCKQMLPRVTSPVLLIQAANDDMTSPRNSEFVREHVGSLRRELVLLEQSYHVVSADLERESVADHLQRFCRSLLGAAAPTGADA